MSLAKLKSFAKQFHEDLIASVGNGDASQDVLKPSQRDQKEMFFVKMQEIIADHGGITNLDYAEVYAKGIKGAPECRCDAWGLAGDAAFFDLFVVEYFGTGQIGRDETLARKQMISLYSQMHGLIRRAFEGMHSKFEPSSAAYSILERILQAKDTITTFRLHVISDGYIPDFDIDNLKLPDEIDGIKIQYEFWDIEKLSRLSTEEREPIKINFEEANGSKIPCIVTSSKEYKTILAFIPGKVLCDVYEEYNQRLLEQNVRVFLKTSNKVNKGIQITLDNEQDRFLAYNNGLCCTASHVVLDKKTDGHNLLSIAEDFQIVNGGQTTASLYHFKHKRGKNLDDVVVQVKITVLQDYDLTHEFVPLISKYANSQSKVTNADLAASGQFHKQLEIMSKTIITPPTKAFPKGSRWFYERTRGSYANLRDQNPKGAKREKWEKEHPKHQRIIKTDVAKFEHAWEGLPHLVCLGGDKNFVKYCSLMADKDDVVVDQKYFKNLVAKAILWKSIEQIYNSFKSFEGARSQTVAYTFSWLASYSGKKINLDSIWKEQKCSVDLIAAIKVVCSEAYNFITGKDGNSTTVAQRVQNWDEFSHMKFDFECNWEDEWAENAFVPIFDIDESMQQEWESLRNSYVNDTRTLTDVNLSIHGPEIKPKSLCYMQVYQFAENDWEALRGKLKLSKNSRISVFQILKSDFENHFS
jgi:hypothetical protein